MNIHPLFANHEHLAPGEKYSVITQVLCIATLIHERELNIGEICKIRIDCLSLKAAFYSSLQSCQAVSLDKMLVRYYCFYYFFR